MKKNTTCMNRFRTCLLMLCLLGLWRIFFLFIVNSEESYSFGNGWNMTGVESVYTKKILLLNSFFEREDYYFGLGRLPFKNHRCPVDDCFLAFDKGIFPAEEYDAVLVHGAEISSVTLPQKRKMSQVYIFFIQESPSNRPLTEKWNGVFNLTMSYRIDSDIIVPSFKIYDMSDNLMSPSEDPGWMEPNNVYYDVPDVSLKNKSCAWFVSNCMSKNRREEYAQVLQNYIDVDIYGACGTLSCPRDDDRCDVLLQEYYFYLSFENSNCLDYVSEKVVTAMDNGLIPVVMGGANYSKFLPPRSYIDASNTHPEDLAKVLIEIAANETLYASYFWWKRYYKIKEHLHPFCELCEMLHNNNKSYKKYDDIFTWWHGTKVKPTCHD